MEDKSSKIFFLLLRIGLGTENVGGNHSIDYSLFADSEVDWNGIYSLGVKQGVGAFIFDALQSLTEAQLIPKDFMSDKKVLMKFYAHTLKVEENWKKHEGAIRSLAQFYAGHDIMMMVLKGYGLSLLYPKPEHRPCGDIDIYLYGEQMRADKLIHEEKRVKVDYSHHHHTVFRMNGVSVENHYDFLNIYAHLSSREIEKELKLLAREERGEAIELEETSVYLPPVMLNAIFLLRHAGAHFAAEEIALRHISDWAMFVKHYHKSIDWQRLCAFAKKQNMDKFLNCLNAICIDYMGIPADCFPTFERDEELVARVLQDTLYPPFSDKSAIGGNPIKDFMYRLKRWWGNRWKHKLVYKEGLILTFLVQVRSHLINPEKIRDER